MSRESHPIQRQHKRLREAIKRLQGKYLQSVETLAKSYISLGFQVSNNPVELNLVEFCTQLQLPEPGENFALAELSSMFSLSKLLGGVVDAILTIVDYEENFITLISAFFKFHYEVMSEHFLCEAVKNETNGDFQSSGEYYARHIAYSWVKFHKGEIYPRFKKGSYSHYYYDLGFVHFHAGAFDDSAYCFERVRDAGDSNSKNAKLWLSKINFIIHEVFSFRGHVSSGQLVENFEAQGVSGSLLEEARFYDALSRLDFFDATRHMDGFPVGSSAIERVNYHALKMFVLVMMGRMPEAHTVLRESAYSVDALMSLDVLDASLNPLKRYALTGLILASVRLFLESDLSTVDNVRLSWDNLNHLVEKAIYLYPGTFFSYVFFSVMGNLFYLHDSIVKYGMPIPELHGCSSARKMKLITDLYAQEQFEKAFFILVYGFMRTQDPYLVDQFLSFDETASEAFQRFIPIMSNLLQMKFVFDSNYRFDFLLECRYIKSVCCAAENSSHNSYFLSIFDRIIYSLIIFDYSPKKSRILKKDCFRRLEPFNNMPLLACLENLRIMPLDPNSLYHHDFHGVCEYVDAIDIQSETSAQDFISGLFDILSGQRMTLPRIVSQIQTGSRRYTIADADGRKNKRLRIGLTSALILMMQDKYSYSVGYKRGPFSTITDCIVEILDQNQPNYGKIHKEYVFQNAVARNFSKSLSAYPGIETPVHAEDKNYHHFFLYYMVRILVAYARGDNLVSELKRDTRTLDEINIAFQERDLPSEGYPEIETPRFHYDWRNSIYAERIKSIPTTHGPHPEAIPTVAFEFTKLTDIDRICRRIKRIEDCNNIALPAYRKISKEEEILCTGARVTGRVAFAGAKTLVKTIDTIDNIKSFFTGAS